MDYFQTCNIHQISLTDAYRRNNEAISATTQHANYRRKPGTPTGSISERVCVCVSVLKMLSRRKMSHPQTFNYQRMESFGFAHAITHG